MKRLIVLFFVANFLFAQKQSEETEVAKTPSTGVLDNQKYTHRYYKSYEEATKTKLQKEYYSRTDDEGKNYSDKMEKKEIQAYFSANVLYEQEKEKFYLFVPPTYNDKREFGIYIHISASPQPLKLNKAWQDVCTKHNLIFVSPYNAENKKSIWRRTALGMDAFAGLRKIYKLNMKRIYGGGMSGGGATAAGFPSVAPTVFAGIISMVRGVSPAEIPPNYFDKNIAEVKFAFISGEKDFNYHSTKMLVDVWLNEKNTKFIKFYDIPGMGHHNISPKVFDEIITEFESIDLKTYRKPRAKRVDNKNKKRK